MLATSRPSAPSIVLSKEVEQGAASSPLSAPRSSQDGTNPNDNNKKSVPTSTSRRDSLDEENPNPPMRPRSKRAVRASHVLDDGVDAAGPSREASKGKSVATAQNSTLDWVVPAIPSRNSQSLRHEQTELAEARITRTIEERLAPTLNFAITERGLSAKRGMWRLEGLPPYRASHTTYSKRHIGDGC